MNLNFVVLKRKPNPAIPEICRFCVLRWLGGAPPAIPKS